MLTYIVLEEEGRQVKKGILERSCYSSACCRPTPARMYGVYKKLRGLHPSTASVYVSTICTIVCW